MIETNKEYRLIDNENETCEIIEVIGNNVKFSYMTEVPSIIDGVGDVEQKTDIMPIDEFLELWEVVPDSWISVEDRLPIDDQRYLVADSYGFMYVKQFLPQLNVFDTALASKITHWMPLPEPPSEVSNDL